jgi:hypothetical protein
MTDRQMETYLRENGYPEHIVRAGRKGLVARWNKFVDEVAKGYKLGLEDYRNDLDLRGIISMAGIENDVADADQRLRALLKPASKPIWESGVGDAFWDQGYPRNASGDLLDDLIAEGLAE